MRQITARSRRSKSNSTLIPSPRPSRTIGRRAVLAAALIGCGTANVAMAQTSGSWIGSTTGPWSTPANWSITSGAGAYPDAGGAATLTTATTTATTITLDVPVTLSALDASLAGGTFTISGTKVMTFTGAATISSPSAKAITFAAPVATGVGTLTDSANTAGTIVFNVGFTGNYVQTSLTTSGLSAPQITNTFNGFGGTSAVAGSLIVNGGTFNLNTNTGAGSSGTFGPNTTITLNAGTLQAVNSVAPSSTANATKEQIAINNRFDSSDSTIINSGTLQFFATNSGSLTGANNAMGLVTIFGGSGAIGLSTSVTDGSQDTRINVTNLVRSSNGALLLRGEGLGQFGTYASPSTGVGTGASFFKISTLGNEQAFMANNLVGSPATTYTSYTTAASTAKDLPIVPWMTGDLNGNTGLLGVGFSTTFVTYMADSSGNGPGFVALGPANFYNALSDGTTSTGNFSMTGAVSLTNPTTVNSLILNDTGGVSGGGTLTITSGALAAFKSAQGLNGVIVSNPINFGASNTREAIIDTGSFTGGADTITLSGLISTSGGLTKAGTGTLVLGTSNSYSGTTTVGAGTLVFTDDTNLGTPPASPTANSIQLGSNSVLNILGTTTINPNRGLTLLGNGSVTMGATVRYNGAITDNGTGKYLTKSGSGALVLGNAASNYGTLTIINSQVNLGAENGLGNVNLQLGFSSTNNMKIFDLSNGVSPTAAFDQTVNNLSLSSTEATPSHAIITNTYIAGNPVTFTDNNAVANTWPGLITGNLILAKSNVGTLTLSGANSYYGGTAMNGGVLAISNDNNLGSGGTSLSFNGGTLLLASVPATNLTARPISVGNNGGTLDIGSNNYDDSSIAAGITGTGAFNKYGTGKLSVTTVRTGGLAVAAGNVTVTPGRDTVNKSSAVTSLAVAGGATLDLNDNDLVDNYVNASGADATKSQAIHALLASGYSGGAWNGSTGIISTTAGSNNANSGNPKVALGFAEASAAGISGTYDGQAVDANTIVIAYTYQGDANLDGIVNALDFNALASNYGSGTTNVWVQGDFDYNGSVNSSDFDLFAANFGQSAALASSPADSQPMAMGALVPEPTSIGLLLVAGTCLLARRRR